MFEHFMTLTRPDFLASLLGLLEKVPQTGWLKKISEIYYLTILVVRSLKSSCQGHTPFRG